MNKGEEKRREKTDIVIGMEWIIGVQGIKDATIAIGDNARIILYLVYIDRQAVYIASSCYESLAHVNLFHVYIYYQ